MSPPYDPRGVAGAWSPSEPTQVQLPLGQFWIWPGSDMGLAKPAPTGPVRIGDAERDRAIASLGDHFAAGRLTQEEFDERVDVAMKARFEQDLEPLFADLPRPEPVPYGPYGLPSGGPRRAIWPALMWVMPLLVVATVVTALVIGAPWMLWGLFWVFIFSGFWGRRRYYGGYRRVGPGPYGRPTGRW